MVETHVSDTFIPEVFGNYVLNQSLKTNRLISSNIITRDPDIDLTQPGTTTTIPFVNDLSGDAENWTDVDKIPVEKLTTGKQRGIKSFQTKAFGYTDLSEIISGAPLADTIASRFSAFWNRVDEKLLIKVLEGAFGVTKVAEAKLFDATAKTPSDAQFGARGFLASIGLMGDLANPSLATIAVNSATYSQMKADNLIDVIQPSQGGLPIETYNGMKIIRDDDIPVDLSDKSKPVTTSYIFAPGAVRYNVRMVKTQKGDKPLDDGGTNYIVQKRIATMHVAGTSVKSAFAPKKTVFPTLDEIANSKTWEVVDGIEPKGIGVVAYKAQLDPMFVPGAEASKKQDSHDDQGGAGQQGSGTGKN